MSLKNNLIVGFIMCFYLLVSCNHKKKANKFFSKSYDFLVLKNPDSALFYVNKGIEVEPKNPYAYNMRGTIYHLFFEKTKDTSYILKEIEEYKSAIKIDSSLWEPYINLGVALYIYGRKKEAVPYLEKGLKLNPDYGARKQVEKMIKEGKK